MRSEPLQRHNARRELGLFLAAHDMREVLLGALKFLIHGCHGPCCHYRVNFEVLNLKPFSSLAFPILPKVQTPLKQPSFGDELVTSSRVPLHSLSSQ